MEALIAKWNAEGADAEAKRDEAIQNGQPSIEMVMDGLRCGRLQCVADLESHLAACAPRQTVTVEELRAWPTWARCSRDGVDIWTTRENGMYSGTDLYRWKNVAGELRLYPNDSWQRIAFDPAHPERGIQPAPWPKVGP